MFNRVILVGRIGIDPEIDQNGSLCATFPLATYHSWKDKKSGETQQSTEWHRIVAWGKLAHVCKNHLKKGRLILIEGELQTAAKKKVKGVEGRLHYSYISEVVATTIKMFPMKLEDY